MNVLADKVVESASIMQMVEAYPEMSFLIPDGPVVVFRTTIYHV